MDMKFWMLAKITCTLQNPIQYQQAYKLERLRSHTIASYNISTERPGIAATIRLKDQRIETQQFKPSSSNAKCHALQLA